MVRKKLLSGTYNMWVRDLETEKETQLTDDGEEYFGYGTSNAGWTKSDRPVLEWSSRLTQNSHISA